MSPYTSLFRSDGSVRETQKQKATMMGGQGAFDGRTGRIQWVDREHLMGGRGAFVMGEWGALNGPMGNIRWVDGSTRWEDREPSLVEKSISL